VRRHRTRLHQQLRELRAAGRRRAAAGSELADVWMLVLGRKARSAHGEARRRAAGLGADAARLERAGAGARSRRRADLERLRLALDAHDPERTLARGYALVQDAGGELVTSAEAARGAPELDLRFADGSLRTRPVKDKR
jgi:exodeoxyribonuclease VII large subunit